MIFSTVDHFDVFVAFETEIGEAREGIGPFAAVSGFGAVGRCPFHPGGQTEAAVRGTFCRNRRHFESSLIEDFDNASFSYRERKPAHVGPSGIVLKQKLCLESWESLQGDLEGGGLLTCAFKNKLVEYLVVVLAALW